MPRQRKPNINPELVNQAISSGALEGLIQRSLQKNKRTRTTTESPVQKIINEGDVTKRPALPEEMASLTGSPESSSESTSDGSSATPTALREKIHQMSQKKSFPSWLLDVGRSRLMRKKSEFEGKPDELALREKELKMNKDEIVSLSRQTKEIRTFHHPESCKCGKGGACATTQTEKGDTARLPVGISREEEENWVTDEAARRDISRKEMNDWYEEQKNPMPIRIAPTRKPEETHPLLQQFDHDPREECHAHGRNPIGHIVSIWNEDGAVAGFPKGAHNIGIVVGIASRGGGGGVKSLSPEIIDAHHEACKDMPIGSHSEECPIGFHDRNCRSGKHAEDCQIPANTITSGTHEGGTLYHVIPWVRKNPEEIQKAYRSKIDFNSLHAPEPEWKPGGMRGLQGGITAPASRCTHLPTSAMEEFLSSGTVQGKSNAQEHFGELEGVVGQRPALLTRTAYYENPLGFSKWESNKSLPGFAHIAHQLENPSTISEKGLTSAPEGFVRGAPPEKPKSDSESILDSIMGQNSKSSSKFSYTHVNESYEQTPSCRFCEDASNKEGKGSIVQTGTASDGRPLYAHEECDNPFSFAEEFKFNFEEPNVVDVDFISMASHNWGMQYQNDARRINKQLGIVTPSAPAKLVDPGFSEPGNTKKINSMGLPEHKAAEGLAGEEEDPATVTQVNNLNANGTAKPPR